MVEAVINLYEDAISKIKVGLCYSVEFPVKVGAHQCSVLLPFLFATVFNMVTGKVRKGLFYKILYADDSVLMTSSYVPNVTRFASVHHTNMDFLSTTPTRSLICHASFSQAGPP